MANRHGHVSAIPQGDGAHSNAAYSPLPDETTTLCDLGNSVHPHHSHVDEWIPRYIFIPHIILAPILIFTTVFFPQNWDVSDFIAAYITIPIFLALYLGHKVYSAVREGIRTVTWARPVQEIDVLYGKREMDELEAMDVAPVPKNFLQKIWFWIA